jgi:hypothetical protein
VDLDVVDVIHECRTVVPDGCSDGQTTWQFVAAVADGGRIARAKAGYRNVKDGLRAEVKAFGRSDENEPEWYRNIIRRATAHLLSPVNAPITERWRGHLGNARQDLTLGISRRRARKKKAGA